MLLEKLLIFYLLQFVCCSTNTNYKFVNALNQQNLQTILLSIEERLRNLDTIYSMQYSPNLEGKLDRFVRKLETIEMKMERLQVKLMSEIDKIATNISNKSYKDDIMKEHILRKLNDVYDRLNHKLIYVELKFEMNDKKIEDKLNIIMKELQKNNENVVTGLLDTETELGDVLMGLDEIRETHLSTQDFVKNISHFTKNAFKQIKNDIDVNREKLIKTLNEFNETHRNRTEKNFDNNEVNFNKIHDKFENTDIALNSYFNKITNMYEEMWNKNVGIENTLKMVSGTLNETRNEQKNGLRALTIEMGRVNGNKNVLSDVSEGDNDKLAKLNRKIDENFENLITTQNMFLESCYRVQMDESRLETKISAVLQKLIDTFEKRTICDDVQTMEKIIKAHDSSVKRNLYSIINKTSSLLNNNEKHMKNIDLNLKILQNKTQSISHLIDYYMDHNKTTYLAHVYGALRNFANDLILLNRNLDKHYNNTEINDKRFEESLKEIRRMLLVNEDKEFAEKINIAIEKLNKRLENFTNGIIIAENDDKQENKIVGLDEIVTTTENYDDVINAIFATNLTELIDVRFKETTNNEEVESEGTTKAASSETTAEEFVPTTDESAATTEDSVATTDESVATEESAATEDFITTTEEFEQ